MENETLVFEKAITRLEEIANILEKNESSLDESLKLFEEGVRLGKFCDSKLKDVEQKIIILKSLDFNETDTFIKKNNNEPKINKTEDEDEDEEDNQNIENKENKIVKKNNKNNKDANKDVNDDKELF